MTQQKQEQILNEKIVRQFGQMVINELSLQSHIEVLAESNKSLLDRQDEVQGVVTELIDSVKKVEEMDKKIADLNSGAIRKLVDFGFPDLSKRAEEVELDLPEEGEEAKDA